MRKQITLEIISFLLILLFVYTATSKLIDIRSFIFVIGTSPFIANFNKFFAWFIPVLELVVATLILVPKFRTWGLLCSFFLMTIFTLYIGAMLVFVKDLPCSCGGVLRQMSWPQHLLFNLTFMALAALGILIDKNNKIFIAINRTSRTPV